MTATLIELNDLSLRCYKSSLQEPGFALVLADRVVIGETARQQARLKPLQAHYHFWQNLNTEALHSTNPRIRHTADLVYWQLQQLTHALAPDEPLVLVVPAHFSRDQLALLLGICQALALNVIAMVDNALASASGHRESGHYVCVDLHLNQCVVTELTVATTTLTTHIERQRHHALAEQGWQSLLDYLATIITDEFIRQCRFDPLHSANSEQALYDQLPLLLKNDSAGQHTMIIEQQKIQLSADLINNHVRTFFQPLLTTLAPWQHSRLLLTPPWQAVANIGCHLTNHQQLADHAISQNCQHHLPMADLIQRQQHKSQLHERTTVYIGDKLTLTHDHQSPVTLLPQETR